MTSHLGRIIPALRNSGSILKYVFKRPLKRKNRTGQLHLDHRFAIRNNSRVALVARATLLAVADRPFGSLAEVEQFMPRGRSFAAGGIVGKVWHG